MKETATVIVGLVLLVVLYVGSYCLMLTPGVSYDGAGRAKPEYRFGGIAVETFYLPAFRLDSDIRPERWPPIPDSGVVIF